MKDGDLPEVQKRPVGRPTIWNPERMEAAKVLYLELLSMGKNEAEINEVKDIPDWSYRWQWKQEPEFSTMCSRAKESAAHHKLQEAECKFKEIIMRAEDEACSPQLATLAKEMMTHARWYAKSWGKKEFGDTVKQEITGAEGKPITLNVKFIDPKMQNLIDVTPEDEGDD